VVEAPTAGIRPCSFPAMPDLETRTVEVETADGTMPLYEAVPDAPQGGLVVIQEVFGVNSHIEDVTRRYADAGYHAVAPHIFHRTGSPTLPYTDFNQVIPHMKDLDDAKVLSDVDAAIAHLEAAGWGRPQLGIVGFCFGGRVSFLVAAERALGAAVGFYGGGIVTSRFPQFPSLVDRAPALRTPWMGLFGSDDQSIPLADVERLRTELHGSHMASEVVVFEGAGHGFHCDARPDHFNEKAAKEAFGQSLEWLGRHLAAA
jgi:carboxymethylenebutenolidase